MFDGGPVGLGTMTVVHSAEGAEGSEPVLPGVYAGGFDALVEMARRVSSELNAAHTSKKANESLIDCGI